MTLRSLFAAAAAVAALLPAQALAANAGFMVLQQPRTEGPPVEIGVWYPTDAPAHVMPLGLWEQTAAPGAPVVAARLPLIVMSHGNGGFFGSHIDTAQALAEAGFVVAAPTHPGDNYKDQSRASAMSDRPATLSGVIGYMLDASPLKASLDPERVGAFGFSSGGFTVLAAAGGKPDIVGTFPAHCHAHPGNYDCRLTASHPIPPDVFTAKWTADARIKAVVSAAPALGFAFGKRGLKDVKVPVQLWRAADDEILPDPDYASAVHAALPQAHDYRVVAGARHFDFLTPCGEAASKQLPALCTSAPGFDRRAFHREFNTEVAKFFASHLVAPQDVAPGR